MKNSVQIEPVNREDGELVGFIQKLEGENIWKSQTIFHYSFATHARKEDAIADVLANGLRLLGEKWEFYSEDDNEWYVCVILEANTETVKIKEGFYSQDDGEVYEIVNPVNKKLRLRES